MKPRTPSPGSHEAVRAGCKCNPYLNCWGLGTPESRHDSVPSFVRHPLCEVHPESYRWTPPPVENLTLEPSGAEQVAERERAAMAKHNAKRKAGRPRKVA